MRELKLQPENTIVDIPDLNRFQIGDHVIVDANADYDRFEGVIIGIELRRMHGSNYLVPSITILHDGCVTDEFKPNDCRKVEVPAPAEHAVGVKPLEWRDDRTAKALGMTYMVWYYSDPLDTGDGNWMWQVVDVVPHASGCFHTKAEAKAAAQPDYERRIRAALSSPMEGGE